MIKDLCFNFTLILWHTNKINLPENELFRFDVDLIRRMTALWRSKIINLTMLMSSLVSLLFCSDKRWLMTWRPAKYEQLVWIRTLSMSPSVPVLTPFGCPCRKILFLIRDQQFSRFFPLLFIWSRFFTFSKLHTFHFTIQLNIEVMETQLA